MAPQLDGHVWLERPRGEHRLCQVRINGNHRRAVVVGAALPLAWDLLHHLLKVLWKQLAQPNARGRTSLEETSHTNTLLRSSPVAMSCRSGTDVTKHTCEDEYWSCRCPWVGDSGDNADLLYGNLMLHCIHIANVQCCHHPTMSGIQPTQVILPLPA